MSKIKFYQRYSDEQLKDFIDDAKRFMIAIEREETVLKNQNQLFESIKDD